MNNSKSLYPKSPNHIAVAISNVVCDSLPLWGFLRAWGCVSHICIASALHAVGTQ